MISLELLLNDPSDITAWEVDESEANLELADILLTQLSVNQELREEHD